MKVARLEDLPAARFSQAVARSAEPREQEGQRGSLMAQSEPTALFAAEMRKAIEGMAQTRELIP